MDPHLSRCRGDLHDSVDVIVFFIVSAPNIVIVVVVLWSGPSKEPRCVYMLGDRHAPSMSVSRMAGRGGSHALLYDGGILQLIVRSW